MLTCRYLSVKTHFHWKNSQKCCTIYFLSIHETKYNVDKSCDKTTKKDKKCELSELWWNGSMGVLLRSAEFSLPLGGWQIIKFMSFLISIYHSLIKSIDCEIAWLTIEIEQPRSYPSTQPLVYFVGKTEKCSISYQMK